MSHKEIERKVPNVGHRNLIVCSKTSQKYIECKDKFHTKLIDIQKTKF